MHALEGCTVLLGIVATAKGFSHAEGWIDDRRTVAIAHAGCLLVLRVLRRGAVFQLRLIRRGKHHQDAPNRVVRESGERVEEESNNSSTSQTRGLSVQTLAA
jgi:hypothetical protein